MFQGDQKRYQFGPVYGVEHALLIWMHLDTQVCMLVFPASVRVYNLVWAEFELSFVKNLAELFLWLAAQSGDHAVAAVSCGFE